MDTPVKRCADFYEKNRIVCDFPIATILLECGHHREQLCSFQKQELTCQADCERCLECGHPCPGSCQDCHSAKTHANCSRIRAKKQKCGHDCAAKCHSGNCPPCQLPCAKSCEHGSCSWPCSLVCDPCVKPCSWSCEHQGPCPTMCSLPCGRSPCNEPCNQILLCGHLCLGICGDICAKKCTQCKTGSAPEEVQMHLKCGHSFELEIIEKYVGLGTLYEIDSNGVITHPRTHLSKLQGVDTNPAVQNAVRHVQMFEDMLSSNSSKSYMILWIVSTPKWEGKWKFLWTGCFVAREI